MSAFQDKIDAKTIRVLIALLLSACLASPAVADLASPAWWDQNAPATAPDWHYRVPVSIPAGAAVRSTIRLDVDFNALLAQMGVSGTFDPASPRVVRPNGNLAATQQFTDRVYSGGTDAAGNGRGEIRFFLQDTGPATYYLYFDITENGTKPPWPANATINGNFEFSSDGQRNPPGWRGRRWDQYDAKAIASRTNVTIGTDGSYPPPSPPQVTTDETARTGNFCYLLGARDNNESQNRNPSAVLQRRIRVPATNPGSLQLRYRVKGWDSADDGSSRWDFIRIGLYRGNTLLRELVGPTAGNYATHPFSPNKGSVAAGSNNSGYGPYNYWDMDLSGTHHAGMTLAPGSEPWFDVSVDLTPYAGQTIRLRIESRNMRYYKSWFHIDDVQWSVIDATPGTPQGFGVNLTAPNDTSVSAASVYRVGDTISLRAGLDAAATPAVDILDPSGAVKAAGITLFDDGSHGDTTAGDGIWANDGSDPAFPTYTFLPADPAGSAWQAVVRAADGSASTTGAPDGTIHIPGRPDTPVFQSNFYNVDNQVFTVARPVLTLVKSADTAAAAPGRIVTYTVRSANTGNEQATLVVLEDRLSPYTALRLNFNGSGPSPFAFNPGGTGLSMAAAAYSNDGGATFTYSPVSGGGGAPPGFDAAVNAWRVTMSGSMNTTGAGFTLQYQVRVK